MKLPNYQRNLHKVQYSVILHFTFYDFFDNSAISITVIKILLLCFICAISISTPLQLAIVIAISALLSICLLFNNNYNNFILKMYMSCTSCDFVHVIT